MCLLLKDVWRIISGFLHVRKIGVVFRFTETRCKVQKEMKPLSLAATHLFNIFGHSFKGKRDSSIRSTKIAGRFWAVKSAPLCPWIHKAELFSVEHKQLQSKKTFALQISNDAIAAVSSYSLWQSRKLRCSALVNLKSPYNSAQRISKFCIHNWRGGEPVKK